MPIPVVVPPSLVGSSVAAGLPLEAVRAGFAWLCHGPGPVTVDTRQLPDLPALGVRRLPVDQLRDLVAAPGCPDAVRDAVWAYLVRRARAEGGTWTLVCAGTALPALEQLCDRLTRRRAQHRGRHQHPARQPSPYSSDHLPSPAGVAVRVEVESAVLTGFLTELAVTDLRRAGIQVRLTAAADEAGRAAYRNLRGAPRPDPALFRTSAAAPSARHPDLVLARAVAAKAITHSEAVLIGATRLEPGRLAAIARARGHSVARTRAARVRAERRLSTYLRANPPGLDVDLGLGLELDRRRGRDGAPTPDSTAVVPATADRPRPRRGESRSENRRRRIRRHHTAPATSRDAVDGPSGEVGREQQS